jgi:hypothetical protein
MSIIQKEIHKCDNCGKTSETEDNEYPMNWFQIEIWKRKKNIGDGVFNKEVCSQKCVTEIMHKFKFPKPKPMRMICHP